MQMENALRTEIEFWRDMIETRPAGTDGETVDEMFRAKTLAEEGNAIQLRYLQTLTEIAGNNSNTIVFPLDLVEKVKKSLT